MTPDPHDPRRLPRTCRDRNAEPGRSTQGADHHAGLRSAMFRWYRELRGTRQGRDAHAEAAASRATGQPGAIAVQALGDRKDALYAADSLWRRLFLGPMEPASSSRGESSSVRVQLVQHSVVPRFGGLEVWSKRARDHTVMIWRSALLWTRTGSGTDRRRHDPRLFCSLQRIASSASPPATDLRAEGHSGSKS